MELGFCTQGPNLVMSPCPFAKAADLGAVSTAGSAPPPGAIVTRVQKEPTTAAIILATPHSLKIFGIEKLGGGADHRPQYLL